MNTSEYLSSVLRTIREIFQPNDPNGSMTVASVAYLVKQRLGLEPASFGFAKFKDLLRELEQRGSIKTGTNSKNALSLWIEDREGQDELIQPTALANGQSKLAQFRMLRSPVWFAFVSDSPAGYRYLNRTTGEVRVGLDQPLDGDWAEITQINPDDEKTEAARFMAYRQLADNAELQQAISNDRWYAEFPKCLAAIDTNFASEWKRERSRRVVTQVEKWCTESAVPSHLVFAQASRIPLTTNSVVHQTQLRDALLTAIGAMATKDLLEINIPAKLLVEVLRPDLLNS